MRSRLPPSLLRRPALAAALLAATAALAADPLPERQCSGGVCIANIDARQAMAPCPNANLVIAWAQAGGAMTLECWTAEAPRDQPILVFDRRFPHAPVWEMTGIRAVAPEALPQIANAQRGDSDALLPACQPPRPPTMAPGELLLAERRPSDDPRHPWCYRILRVATTATGIAIRADDGQSPKPQPDAPDWAPLATKMAALADRADAPARAHVTRSRASLRDAPDPKSPVHGFLVAGDAVVVLDPAPGKPLVKVLYVSARGPAIERWIARADIAF